MYDQRSKRIDDRIVSISQPHVREIRVAYSIAFSQRDDAFFDAEFTSILRNSGESNLDAGEEFPLQIALNY